MVEHLCWIHLPSRPSGLWVASVLPRLFLCLQTPANFRPCVVGVNRRGGDSGWGVFGRAAAVIGKYISFWRAHSFILCFCCQRFSFMLGQMTTELKCRAMLSLQQLYTPENFFVWVAARGKSRYKLISLTFQETLLFPLSPPRPHRPQRFLHAHTHRSMTTGWHRAERERGGRWCSWCEERPTSHGSDNDTTLDVFAETLRWSNNKNPDNSLSPFCVGLRSTPSFLTFPFSFLSDSLHEFFPSSLNINKSTQINK